jgi:uncharacterized FAD-dependent dehydrogenase
MASLRLCEHGYRPLVLERGRRVPQRIDDVTSFLKGGPLNTESNLLFGAGGAGTFSDGKLYTRTGDPRVLEVLRRFTKAGAPPEILVEGRPHVGTDRLRLVVEKICRQIESGGGEILWGAPVREIIAHDNDVIAVRTPEAEIPAGTVIFTAGPYARDSFELLHRAGVAMACKPFQMGLRIEHPQDLIDRAVFGDAAGHPKLGAADYVLHARGEPGVVSFCVCPGGQVLPAVAERSAVCTNGMSRYRRDSGFCNGALVATLAPGEFPGEGPLAGLEVQRHYERLAFTAAGGDYVAPAQTAPDFLRGVRGGVSGPTTYTRGVRSVLLDEILPATVASAIRRALKVFDKRIPGFAGKDALLLGPETCSSCPVRVLRAPETRESQSLVNLYPAGAGSGYAAGIMSSAVDGLLTAEAVIRRFTPPTG